MAKTEREIEAEVLTLVGTFRILTEMQKKGAPSSLNKIRELEDQCATSLTTLAASVLVDLNRAASALEDIAFSLSEIRTLYQRLN